MSTKKFCPHFLCVTNITSIDISAAFHSRSDQASPRDIWEWRVPTLCWECKLMESLWKTVWRLLQFSSVAQSCPTVCNPMNHSTPGLPVHHQLPEFTQTHAHRVSDAIQPSHPLSSPSPPAPNPSQHQSLFQWVIQTGARSAIGQLHWTPCCVAW